MSSEDYEIFRVLEKARKALRAKHAVACPECVTKLPRANPTMLLPKQRCRIHNYTDPRPLIDKAEVDAIFLQFGITRTK